MSGLQTLLMTSFYWIMLTFNMFYKMRPPSVTMEFILVYASKKSIRLQFSIVNLYNNARIKRGFYVTSPSDTLTLYF